MIDKRLKYFCQKCKTIKGSKIIMLHSGVGTPEEKHWETEVIEEWLRLKSKSTVRKGKFAGSPDEIESSFKARQLECNHFISFYTPAFKDLESETIDEFETKLIREGIDKAMLGKTAAELESTILFHVDQYNTLKKIAVKQKKQADYAIQYLDQLREKYSSLLADPDIKKSFEQKFAHFLDLKPQANKAGERERDRVDKEANKKQLAIDAVKNLLLGKGYKAKDLLVGKNLCFVCNKGIKDGEGKQIKEKFAHNKCAEMFS